MPAAARLTDFQECPVVDPGVPPSPHVGGPLQGPGVPTVMIGGLPAVTVGDTALCVGSTTRVVTGSKTVLIGGRPAARMGDSTDHGGKILLGCFTVLIGD